MNNPKAKISNFRKPYFLQPKKVTARKKRKKRKEKKRKDYNIKNPALTSNL